MSEKPVSLTPVPEGYADWLAELKSRIHTAQQRATLAVNQELVLLYWQIGLLKPDVKKFSHGLLDFQNTKP